MKQELRTYIENELRSQGDDLAVADDDDLVIAGLDSIGFVRLVDFIEQLTDVRIPPETVTLENFGTIERIASHVGRLNGRDGPAS